jgi:hypothetical protein
MKFISGDYFSNKAFFYFPLGGVEPSRLLLRPLLAYCTSQDGDVSVEQSVE